MGVRVLCGQPPVVLPERVAPHVGCLAVVPGLELQVRDGTVLVEVRDSHGALVRVVVDHFSTQVPLLLFTEQLEDVVGAHFHYADFVGEASIR